MNVFRLNHPSFRLANRAVGRCCACIQNATSDRLHAGVFAMYLGLVGYLGLGGPPLREAMGQESLTSSQLDVLSETAMERGESIYRNKCASCHGDAGQGVEEVYPKPLTGDATIGELSRLIHDTMPEGEPEQCVGPDAQTVAEFIHHRFYSEAAQIRNRPPRQVLARLTGNQLRQSLADLYAHSGEVLEVAAERGVKGVYYDGDRRKNESKKIERVDPILQFDFGRESPGEGIQADAFHIHWEGGLKVDQTGRYEIIVRSTCSFTMDFGKIGRKLIDNHVQSGDKTEFRQSIFLTAGRIYPFAIEFYQRKRKTEIPPAKFSMSWIPPHGLEQTVPTSQLIPASYPGVFALQAALPPDDRSYGFERGIAINRQWDDSTTSAAIEFAMIVTDELWPRFQRKRKDSPNENREHLKAFLNELLAVAFRGPLDQDAAHLYIDRQIEMTPDDLEAIKRVLLVALKSPRFLYPLADANQSFSQRAANRLSLTLHDSLPSDRWLLQSIAANQLSTEDQIRSAAQKMVQDLRTRAKTRELIYEWLNLTHQAEISKDEKLFQGFDRPLAEDLKNSFDTFLNHIVWQGEGDFRQLFLADWSYTTPRMADFYGEAWKSESDTFDSQLLSKTRSDATLRFGLLTHPFLMSSLAYHDSTSPIHRGVFLLRHLLGRSLRPPNEAFTPLSPDLHPDLTTRQRVALQTSPESCQSCHIKINGLGFVLENYDAVGRYRQQEGEKTVDASGVYTDRNDKNVALLGAAALARYLADSPDSHRAFVSRAFQHFVKQPPAAFGPKTLDQLMDSFVKSGYSVPDLIEEIAVIAALAQESIQEQEN